MQGVISYPLWPAFQLSVLNIKLKRAMTNVREYKKKTLLLFPEKAGQFETPTFQTFYN